MDNCRFRPQDTRAPQPASSRVLNTTTSRVAWRVLVPNLWSPGVPTPRADERLGAQINLQTAIYTDNAKPVKELTMLRAERELRQQGVRRQDRNLCADCLELSSGNKLRDEERGDRKSGRAAARPKHSSTLINAVDVSI
eukprot:6201655-Pleurochrysis_carterae.AAC.5